MKNTQLPTQVDHVIVGTGFAGLTLFKELTEAKVPMDSIVVLERHKTYHQKAYTLHMQQQILDYVGSDLKLDPKGINCILEPNKRVKDTVIKLNRERMVQHLDDLLKELEPNFQSRIFFDYNVESVSPESKSIRISRRSEDTEYELRFENLYGCDGVNSRVRTCCFNSESSIPMTSIRYLFKRAPDQKDNNGTVSSFFGGYAMWNFPLGEEMEGNGVLSMLPEFCPEEVSTKADILALLKKLSASKLVLNLVEKQEIYNVKVFKDMKIELKLDNLFEQSTRQGIFLVGDAVNAIGVVTGLNGNLAITDACHLVRRVLAAAPEDRVRLQKEHHSHVSFAKRFNLVKLWPVYLFALLRHYNWSGDVNPILIMRTVFTGMWLLLHNKLLLFLLRKKLVIPPMATPSEKIPSEKTPLIKS